MSPPCTLHVSTLTLHVSTLVRCMSPPLLATTPYISFSYTYPIQKSIAEPRRLALKRRIPKNRKSAKEKECMRHNPRALNRGLRPRTPRQGAFTPWAHARKAKAPSREGKGACAEPEGGQARPAPRTESEKQKRFSRGSSASAGTPKTQALPFFRHGKGKERNGERQAREASRGLPFQGRRRRALDWWLRPHPPAEDTPWAQAGKAKAPSREWRGQIRRNPQVADTDGRRKGKSPVQGQAIKATSRGQHPRKPNRGKHEFSLAFGKHAGQRAP